MQTKFSILRWKRAKANARKCRQIDRKKLKDSKPRIEGGIYRA